jgi:hypothetical protein
MASKETTMAPITVQIIKQTGANAQGNEDDPLIVNLDSLNTPVRTNLEGVGNVTIGTSQVEIAITGTPTASIRIQADNTNTGIIYIGLTGVLSNGSNDFVRLESGDEVIIDYNDASNALYAISGSAAQKINVGALL